MDVTLKKMAEPGPMSYGLGFPPPDGTGATMPLPSTCEPAERDCRLMQPRSLGLCPTSKFRRLRIVYITGYGTVLYPFNSLIDCKKRNEEPFFRDDGGSETVIYFNIHTGAVEKSYGSGFQSSCG